MSDATAAKGPLDGVKIVDLTHYITGPYCTKLFADYGADVVKIERPDGGDRARNRAPFWHDKPHLEGMIAARRLHQDHSCSAHHVFRERAAEERFTRFPAA